ncbi:MAG: hypothetical protein PHR06_14740 [Candidatus Cloacimonetes bacterium]|nr:hypothetical protein [Candidatus Cloacimonadota bacterium]
MRETENLENKKTDRVVMENCEKNTMNEVLIRKLVMSTNLTNMVSENQPWHCVIIKNPFIKKSLLKQVSINENTFNHDSFFSAINETDFTKENESFIIVVFKKNYEITPEGMKKNIFVEEAAGLVAGLMLAYVEQTGLPFSLSYLTGRSYINEILSRPDNEQAVVMIAVGDSNCKNDVFEFDSFKKATII